MNYVQSFFVISLQWRFTSWFHPKSPIFSVSTGSFFVNCGSTASYVDNVTGITWMPDDQFIDKNSGVNTNVSSASLYYPNFSELITLRYFPDSRAKNCYSFPVTPNETYQIRGTFFYGNYDNQTTVPSFQMGVDGTIVASNIINELYLIAYQEITYVPQRNETFLCLSRDLTNSVPFISAISLVNITGASAVEDNLHMGYYYTTQFRWNFGGNEIIRYVISQNYVRSIQVNGRCCHVIYFTNL